MERAKSRRKDDDDDDDDDDVGNDDDDSDNDCDNDDDDDDGNVNNDEGHTEVGWCHGEVYVHVELELSNNSSQKLHSRFVTISSPT